MIGRVFPLWVFAFAAVVIAATAFGAAQIASGAGAVVVLAGTTAWMMFVQRRVRHLDKANG